ncbi:hypothetical protein LTS09_018247, partial [Friedmanniomyces endolithicus]
MLSIQPTAGNWMKPGNYSSNLSKTIWIIQLIIFYDTARRDRRGEGQTLTLIKECCEVHLQQGKETPMGEILRWRLLFFYAVDHSVGDQRAVRDEENDAVIYNHATPKMDQIPTLLRTECRRCRHLLYRELTMDPSRVQHMSALSLQDRATTVLSVGASRTARTTRQSLT